MTDSTPRPRDEHCLQMLDVWNTVASVIIGIDADHERLILAGEETGLITALDPDIEQTRAGL
jgi:hypothetical protein